MLTNAIALLAATVLAGQAQDLLPDITVREDNLYDNSIDRTTLPGRVLFRLSTATPNVGIGRLELRGGTVINSTTQEVNQRIFRTDGTWWERTAGTFTYHAQHSHIHFDDWCVYRIRAVTTGNGVGPVLRTGRKTSFCILDLQIHDPSNPGYVNPGYYRGCGAVIQGLTPGWMDVYSKNLTDQWVDITDLPNGTYWLEAEVDPNNNILEASEGNNVSRILVSIDVPPPPEVDRYEPNESIAQVNGRQEGGLNSPNLGTVNVLTSYDHLSIHTQSDNDYFRFRLNNTGRAGDYVRLTSPFGTDVSDLDLKLYNASGQEIGSSVSGTNTEQITLSGRPPGYYYVRVYSYRGSNPRYMLTIQPSGNNPPTLTVHGPSEDVFVERGLETFPVDWTTTDPDNDPIRIALFRCLDNVENKETGMIGGYENLPGHVGTTNVNTAEMPLGSWFLFVRATDGGSFTGRYSVGKFTVYVKGDLNYDGRCDEHDVRIYQSIVRRWPPAWNHILDMNRDGVITPVDIRLFYHNASG
jgi:hypothetical protein